MRIYMVRHGETVWNRDLLFTGQSDIDLTDKGRTQAMALGRRLKDVAFDRVFASDLKRAVETAGLILGQGDAATEDVKAAISLVPGLREADFGEWEGESWASLSEKCPDKLAWWREDPARNAVPGGESFQALQQRTVVAMEEIVQACQHSCPAGNILVVSHAGTIRMYLAAILRADINQVWRLRQDNASLNILQVSEGEPFINLLNDTAHLEGM